MYLMIPIPLRAMEIFWQICLANVSLESRKKGLLGSGLNYIFHI